MNYTDEPYVRLYVNDTVNWQLLGWEGKCVALLLLKGKLDRAGVFEHGRHDVSHSVTAVTGLPKEVASEGVKQLLSAEVLVAGDGCLVWPNYIEAQTARRTDVARKRDERHRSQTKRLATDQGHTPSHSVTLRHNMSPEAEAEAEAEAEDHPPSKKTQGGRKPRQSPHHLSVDWLPPPEQAEALAKKWGAHPSQMLALVPEFVWYWREGKGRGKRRAATGWQQAFGNHADTQAQREKLPPPKFSLSAPEEHTAPEVP